MDTVSKQVRNTLLGLAIASCCVPAAHATIVYSGPSTYVINTTVTDNVVVNNSAAVLNVESGGVVRGVNDPAVLGAVRTQAGTMNVTGTGKVVAGAGQSTAISMRGYPAVVRLQDRAAVTGDVVMEYNTPGWRSESTAATRLYVQDRSVINGNLIYAGFVRVEDRGRINGDVLNATNGSVSMDMRGGQVTGQVAFGNYNDYVFNLSGGSILGGLRGDFGYMDMTMSGGYIGNGFRTGDFVDGVIGGGQIAGGIEIWHGIYGGASDLTFTGGQFDTTAGDYLLSMTGHQYDSRSYTSSLDIQGGQWGYCEAGLGFFFDEQVDFSISGWDLTFVNGLLSGYLLDGSWFSNFLSFGSAWSGMFTINNVTSPLAAVAQTATSVPEPGTLGIFAVAVLGMVLARRRAALTH